MGVGCFQAFWLWFPLLVYKAIASVCRTLWHFNLWILQSIAGVPLYYCRPEYRLPALMLGTIGVLCLFNSLMLILIPQHELASRQLSLNEILLIACGGIGLLLLSRYLIRRGSI